MFAYQAKVKPLIGKEIVGSVPNDVTTIKISGKTRNTIVTIPIIFVSKCLFVVTMFSSYLPFFEISLTEMSQTKQ